MALNCRPGQRAWICIPETLNNQILGLTGLHGHVVQTVRLSNDQSLRHLPAWVVDPPQSCVVVGPIPKGLELRVGEVLDCSGIPDEFLRPFDDLPPEEIEERDVEVVTS